MNEQRATITDFRPYVGPRPFERTKADQERFFGRTREASELLSRITAHSAVLFYSQSGAGKTSLINAKLSSMLEKAGFDVLKPARVRDVSWEDLQRQQVANVYIFNALRSWDDAGTDATRLAGMSLEEFLSERKASLNEENEGMPRVAIFDQFEEMFTSYQERLGDREQFFEQIGDALENDRLLRVVFAMREEYIAELDPYLSLLPEKLRTRFRLERLSEDDALLAITEPLKGTEYSFAAGVAEQLVSDLLMVPIETSSGVSRVRGESVEPVQLQVVCQTLWENCQESWRKLESGPSDPKVITPEYLENFGDVDQALSTFYESVLGRVVQNTRVKEGILRRWFEQSLITTAGTRGTVYRGRQETGGIPNEAVDQLVDQHIIRGEVRGGGSRWYELTHDRLIPPIKASNERWLLEHSGGEQTPKRLETRAEQWVRDGRKRQELLDEGELLEARRWLDSPEASDVGFSEMLFALVQASRAASEEAARERDRVIAVEQQRAAEAERERAKEQQRRLEIEVRSAKRLRWLATSLAVMVVCAVGASVFAWRKQNEASKKQAEAERQAIELLAAISKADSANRQAQMEREIATRERASAQRERVQAQIEREIAVKERQRAVIQSQIAQQQLRKINSVRARLEADEPLASTLWRDGNYDQALSLYDKIHSYYRLIGDTKGQERTKENIATVTKLKEARK
jgi:conflict system STAND superfamily ATPase